ncbi:MAG: cupin domain-containing protein [Gammaproteobacteria bacterium]|nr:cupin domain-containing protein [Gammaproteobacteria bacterium]
MNKPILNINDLEFMDWGQGERFAARFGLISRRIGANGLGYNLTVVPPGKRAFPFHSHRVNDEMFFIVSGSGQIRIGDKLWDIREGDVIACPPGGPETAHQIINNSDADLEYLAVSTTMSPEVAEYPDSDKVGVIMELEDSKDGMPEIWRLMMKSESTQVDYWEGENTD